MKKKILSYLPFILIVVLGIALRTLFLNISPPSLNEDEAALGYNAFSILRTGADEHGVFLPLSLESFGDWKLPVYSYIDIPPIAVFGLTEFAVRFPSILAGVAGIILIYFISRELFKKKTISLFSAFFFAVSPWSIFFSRAAYEVNVGMSIFLAGFLLYLLGEKKKKKWYLLSSGVLFGVTLFTYHSFIIFTPLFVFALGVFTWKKLKKNILFLTIPLALFMIVTVFTSFSSGSKLSTTTIFTNKNIIYNRVENFKKDTIANPPVLDKIYTKYVGVPYQLLQNYLSSFSPTFLFDRGGEKLVHNLDGFGNIYIFDALLLLVGIAGIFYFREKQFPVLLVWLFLAPIPSAMTIDAPNSTRLFILMPLFVLISGYGAFTLLQILRKNTLRKAILGGLGLLFMLNVFFFLDLYFIHFGYHRARFWHYGYKEAVALSNTYPEAQVVMRGPENFPYIYFLFYNRYDPKIFQKEVSFYPKTWDGFRYVKNFGRYTFTDDIDYGKQVSNVLYIDDRGFKDPSTTIKLPNGDPILQWEYKK
ncbi:MAG: ArnT family glycosyltransferase [Candidatus Levyibacteriota bacterium]